MFRNHETGGLAHEPERPLSRLTRPASQFLECVIDSTAQLAHATGLASDAPTSQVGAYIEYQFRDSCFIDKVANGAPLSASWVVRRVHVQIITTNIHANGPRPLHGFLQRSATAVECFLRPAPPLPRCLRWYDAAVIVCSHPAAVAHIDRIAIGQHEPGPPADE